MEKSYSQFLQSVLGFVRLLRKSGIKVGTDVAIKTSKVVSTVPLKRHEDLYWALKASLITDQQHKEIFDQLFALYWGNAKLPDSALAASLPRSKVKSKGEKSFSKRTQDAFDKKQPTPPSIEETEIETLNLSWSDQERLQKMDFESMSANEYQQAKKLLTKMKLTFKPVKSRRFKATSQVKKIDFRKTLKQSSKYNFETIDLRYRKPRLHYPPLVIFIDISGSMSRYAQIMLQFAYLLSEARSQVHVYLFATLLTCITSALRNRDIDEALARVGDQVNDWKSGTRIGDCIKYFNINYLKRIVNSKSQILLITDGLDRGDQNLFNMHLARLKRSSKTLIWLNPLLRYDAYEPKTKGATTLLPHVDRMLPIHNLESLAQLVNFLHLNINQTTRKAA